MQAIYNRELAVHFSIRDVQKELGTLFTTLVNDTQKTLWIKINKDLKKIQESAIDHTSFLHKHPNTSLGVPQTFSGLQDWISDLTDIANLHREAADTIKKIVGQLRR